MSILTMIFNCKLPYYRVIIRSGMAGAILVKIFNICSRFFIVHLSTTLVAAAVALVICCTQIDLLI